jgi:hypothetical protein
LQSLRQDVISEQAFGLTLDNGLLVADVVAGKPTDQTEVLSLMAMAESLYVTATLESRQLGNVQACHQLWAEVARLFNELCNGWTDVRSDDQSIVWLKSRLNHFQNLCRDRTSLYTISEAERRQYQERRSIEVETSFGEREFL